MSSLPAALESHLSGEITTHCFCWIIRRADKVVFGFTDHDKILLIDGVSCEPQTGLSASEAASALGLSVDTAEIEGALSSLAISDSDIERGAFDGASVETFLVNWASPEQYSLLRSSRIGTISRSGGRFVAELKSSSVDLDKISGRRVTRQCDAQLGDSRCGYKGPAQKASVTRLISDREIVVNGLRPPDSNWFRNGILSWANGSRNVVLAHQTYGEGIRLSLRDSPIPDIKISDTFLLNAGCDKSFAQCKAKFGNSANFRGFPHLPGNDAIYNFANGKGNFDGGPLVP
ncbi:DUF2163 domain-containing protein [Phyllobacterium sp. K27]